MTNAQLSKPPTTWKTSVSAITQKHLNHRLICFTVLVAIAFSLAPTASHAEQASQPPKLSKSYLERVEQLRDQVDDGVLSEVAGTIVSGAGGTPVPVDRLGANITWWQYEDETTFIHVTNDTSKTIAGLELSFWVDSCAQKAAPPRLVYVLLRKPLERGRQAVVKIPPNKSIHTTNEVSCLKIRGAWSK